MSITDTVYRVAHAFPGGIPALAVRMGISKHVLQNKVNPNNDTHKLSAEEAAQIADLADCDEIAKAYAERRNMICVPIAQHEGASDMEILDLVVRMNTAESKLLQEMSKALADGKVDDKEIDAVKKEAREHMAAIAELVCRLEGMVR
jgi:hypothetical protein